LLTNDWSEESKKGTPLVVTAHVVAEPYKSQRLSDATASRNEIPDEVVNTKKYMLHIQ